MKNLLKWFILIALGSYIISQALALGSQSHLWIESHIIGVKIGKLMVVAQWQDCTGLLVQWVSDVILLIGNVCG